MITKTITDCNYTNNKYNENYNDKTMILTDNYNHNYDCIMITNNKYNDNCNMNCNDNYYNFCYHFMVIVIVPGVNEPSD